MDEDGEYITMNTEEEFTESLRAVPNSGNILELYLNETETKIECTPKKVYIIYS